MFLPAFDETFQIIFGRRQFGVYVVVADGFNVVAIAIVNLCAGDWRREVVRATVVAAADAAGVDIAGRTVAAANGGRGRRAGVFARRFRCRRGAVATGAALSSHLRIGGAMGIETIRYVMCVCENNGRHKYRAPTPRK